MATNALPEPNDSRFAPYIEELREFLATSGIAFGSPEDIFAIADRVQEPGSFSDDLSSLVRSIVLREGGAMAHAQLLEVLSLAIAGPEIADNPQQYREPLRELLAFVLGVMRRPWNIPPSESAEVVPFPSDSTSAPSSIATTEPATRVPAATFEQIREAQIRQEQNREPHSEIPSGRAAAETGHPIPAISAGDAGSPRSLTTLRRNALIGAAATVAVGAILVLALRPHPTPEVFHIGPAPRLATASPSSLSTTTPPPQSAPAVESGSGPLASQPVPVPGKPSANGDESRLRLKRRPQAPVSAWADSPPATPQPTRSQLSASPPSVNPSSTASGMSEAPAAPIIRRPADGDSDASIVGDMPDGQIRSATSSSQYFTVSSGVMAAYLIFSPDPDYPTLARIAHIHGEVILQAVVAKDGSVSAIRVLRGNRLLRGAAVEAVRRWRYRPYRLGGKPVDVATIVTVDFHSHN